MSFEGEQDEDPGQTPLRPILARQMEVYAGFLEHADYHIQGVDDYDLLISPDERLRVAMARQSQGGKRMGWCCKTSAQSRSSCKRPWAWD